MDACGHWFPGATLNYAELALRAPGVWNCATNPQFDHVPALISRSQTRPRVTLTRSALRDQVARVAAGLRRLGVVRGDRVVGYLPNVPEAVTAFLACASLGAVWSSCAPEFGVKGVIDRVRQIEPKVLIAVDGYRYGDRTIARMDAVAAIRAELPSLEATVVLPYLDSSGELALSPFAGPPQDLLVWHDLLGKGRSSGVCTGSVRPSALRAVYVRHHRVAESHRARTRGIALELLKLLSLHHDLGSGDRFFWFTTTGWMMWNYLVSGLLVGATVVLFDGDPGWPDTGALWSLAAEEHVSVFGASASYLLRCRKPRTCTWCGTGSVRAPLGLLYSVATAGRGIYLGTRLRVERCPSRFTQRGTDVCTAFVGPCPLLPVTQVRSSVAVSGPKWRLMTDAAVP